MGQKDIVEKTLESYNDVFADIVNVLLFNGREVIKEQELEEVAPRSAYMADGMLHELERDVVKRWKVEDIRLACIGMENQSDTDSKMPIRVLAYEGAEYRNQLNKKTQAYCYPVVTLVLYFNHDKRWNKPISLLECLKIPEDFYPYVNDYHINLFEIAYLSPEQVKLFKSDFKFVADYFVQMRTTGTYTGSDEEIKHVQETLNLMSVVTKDYRFEEAANISVENKKENKTMSEFLDKIIMQGRNEGRAEGRIEGEQKGRAEGRIEGEQKGRSEGRNEGRIEGMRDAAINMYHEGIPFDTIVKITKQPANIVMGWLGLQTA